MDETTALKNRIGKEKALLVYFYNDDCSPCIRLRPKVKDLLVNSFPKMKLIFVDSRSYPEIPVTYGVYTNPAILLFFEGKEYRRFSKFVSMIELEETIQRYYNLLF